MEDYVSFELAKKLREKGFSERTFGAYVLPVKLVHFPLLYSLKNWNKEEKVYSAPTISQVLKWLRIEKDLHLEIVASAYGYSYIINKTPFFGGSEIKSSELEGPNDGGAWDEWEEAALAGIEYVLNLI